eukprot:CAMPEP_0197657738 /NCGR_PEP_ID=MMETSP1338-20131121/44814_1 /TAXON_ID=43686 ORGANISM="Pelagodinium beii, Strain RCC1491" /NCGR_SAMPLE_ID=MMETSP1338 /ASSEMBLY_ACC=CAM_ASM_000754 /LENGTH=228 /DNA_ID=CAMNT_0043234179 /DNA_START=257 /DNA_END=944 /DNA_ORIENTATION=+
MSSQREGSADFANGWILGFCSQAALQLLLLGTPVSQLKLSVDAGWYRSLRGGKGTGIFLVKFRGCWHRHVWCSALKAGGPLVSAANIGRTANTLLCIAGVAAAACRTSAAGIAVFAACAALQACLLNGILSVGITATAAHLTTAGGIAILAVFAALQAWPLKGVLSIGVPAIAARLSTAGGISFLAGCAALHAWPSNGLLSIGVPAIAACLASAVGIEVFAGFAAVKA